jgi:hypothetical protein
MKAKALFTVFFLMACLFAKAQNQKWEVHIGINGRYDEAEGLTEVYDNGYYIDGGYDIDGHWYGWEIKTDINGIPLWAKTLQHDIFEIASIASVTDFDGNIYTCGFKMVNTTWPFISKLNSCGNKEWCKIIADDQLHNGSSIDILINENDEIIVLSNYMSIEGQAQIFLECYDKDGEYLWKKHYAKQEDYPWIDVTMAYDLMENNHGYYISGYCYWPFPSDTTHYYQRPLFIGIDSLFNEKWILPFYALDSVFGKAYKTIPLNDTTLMGVGIRRLDGNVNNALIMIYNINGEEVEYSQIPNDSIGNNLLFNYFSQAERIDDTLFISMLYLASLNGNPLPYSDVVFDKNAKVYNLVARPPNAEGWAHIIKSSDGNFVNAMGWENPNGDKDIYLYKIDKNLQPVPFDPNTYTYDSLCPEPIQSGTIDLSDCMMWTGAEEIPSPEEYYSFIATIPITAYPNPAETEITLAFQNTEHHSNMMLECYNIYGQKVHTEKIWKGQQQTKMDVSGWSKGLYFAVAKSNGKVAGTGRFVRK